MLNCLTRGFAYQFYELFICSLPVTHTVDKWPSDRYWYGTWYLYQPVLCFFLCLYSDLKKQSSDILPNEHEHTGKVIPIDLEIWTSLTQSLWLINSQLTPGEFSHALLSLQCDLWDKRKQRRLNTENCPSVHIEAFDSLDC